MKDKLNFIQMGVIKATHTIIKKIKLKSTVITLNNIMYILQYIIIN